MFLYYVFVLFRDILKSSLKTYGTHWVYLNGETDNPEGQKEYLDIPKVFLYRQAYHLDSETRCLFIWSEYLDMIPECNFKKSCHTTKTRKHVSRPTSLHVLVNNFKKLKMWTYLCRTCAMVQCTRLCYSTHSRLWLAK